MTINKICLALLVLFVAGPFALGEDSADAKYLEIRKEYTLLVEGGVVKRHEHKLEYLTPYAFSRILGETFIVYNPEFQELKVEKSVTTLPGGQLVEATPNSFNEILPGFCRNAPQYMHLREMVVTHLGLDNGSVAELAYELRSKQEFAPFLMGEELFASNHPVEKMTVVVRVPRDKELKYQLLNHEGFAPAEGEDGEYRTYTWEMGPLAPIPPEGMSQAQADYAPLLVFSTSPSWKDTAGLLNSWLSSAMWLSEAATEKVREIRRDSNTGVEFVRNVNRFVVEEVATASVDNHLMGYRPRKAGDTYAANVGSPLDKMVLLVAMLRHEGYFAQPVFVSRHCAVADEVPSWTQFSQCRIICSLRDRLDKPLFLENLLFLSPTRLVSGVFEDHLAGRTVFRPSLMNNQLHKVAPSGEPENRVKADLTLKLDSENRLGGSVALEVGGSLNPYIGLVEDAQGKAKGLLKKVLPGAEVEGIEPYLLGEKRSMFRCTTKTGAALETGEGHDLLMWMVPGAPGGVMTMGIPTDSKERANPLMLPRIMVEDTDVAIELTDALEVAAMPPQKQIDNAVGSLVSGAWVDEGMLYVKRRLVLNKQLITPEEYPALRALLVEWMAEDSRRIVFKPLKDA